MKHLGKEITKGEAYNEELHLHCRGYLTERQESSTSGITARGLTKTKEKEGATTNIMA